MSEQTTPRPFCGQWPYSVSDLDLVLPKDNDRVHKARGCCDGFLPPTAASGPYPTFEATERITPC